MVLFGIKYESLASILIIKIFLNFVESNLRLEK